MGGGISVAWEWQWAGISCPLSVSLTRLPLSPVALTGDAQRFRHGGGISDVAADGGGRVGMAMGGCLSPSLYLSPVALTGDDQRFRHGQHRWTWRRRDGRGGFEV
jgi:hypothetical protein